MKTKESTPIAPHFNLLNHSTSNFAKTAIEKIPDVRIPFKRLLKKMTWQNLLQTAFSLRINNLKPVFLE